MYKLRIRSFKYPKFPMHVTELHELLGFKANKLPDAGFPVQVIQGVKVWAVPKAKKVGFIRTFCECPGCGRVLTLKCLNQHVCAKPLTGPRSDLASNSNPHGYPSTKVLP